eukprot:CAMPEP_0185038528 /NCGR_PEP_ID=MMETSP1103-20130426/34282_1 /TAXON_ID=36769 /ORGANISM="Paraphysomonas bandaiensis, Strain Caron Lab Isolate" /LENGTH=416 /DNA_ID=CAMNT_0027576997 /DNA_START=254 /DNA_END=1504 /DNA_ORIENTATION=+
MSHDEEFRRKVQRRRIEKENAPKLQPSLAAEERAYTAWHSHQDYSRFNELTRKASGLKNAISHMEHKVKNFTDVSPKSERTRSMLTLKRSELKEVIKEVEQIEKGEAYQQWKKAVKVRKNLEKELGLEAANSAIGTLQREGGHRRQVGGVKFEDIAEDIIKEYVIPAALRRHGISDSHGIVVIRNVTLGMASVAGSPGEIDALICRITGKSEVGSTGSAYTCKVLGVVEVKKNADDIGSAFDRYQRSLAWLTGMKDRYIAEEWKTAHHPSGHFTRPYKHALNSSINVEFTQDSFSLITPRAVHLPGHMTAYMKLIDNSNNTASKECLNCFCEDLYFITKDAAVENMGSKLYNLTTHRLASGLEFDDELSDETQLESLRESLLEKNSQYEYCTFSVLKLFEHCKLFDQVIVLEKPHF